MTAQLLSFFEEYFTPLVICTSDILFLLRLCGRSAAKKENAGDVLSFLRDAVILLFLIPISQPAFL